MLHIYLRKAMYNNKSPKMYKCQSDYKKAHDYIHAFWQKGKSAPFYSEHFGKFTCILTKQFQISSVGKRPFPLIVLTFVKTLRHFTQCCNIAWTTLVVNFPHISTSCPVEASNFRQIVRTCYQFGLTTKL